MSTLLHEGTSPATDLTNEVAAEPIPDAVLASLASSVVAEHRRLLEQRDNLIEHLLFAVTRQQCRIGQLEARLLTVAGDSQ